MKKRQFIKKVLVTSLALTMLATTIPMNGATGFVTETYANAATDTLYKEYQQAFEDAKRIHARFISSTPFSEDLGGGRYRIESGYAAKVPAGQAFLDEGMTAFTEGKYITGMKNIAPLYEGMARSVQSAVMNVDAGSPKKAAADALKDKITDLLRFNLSSYQQTKNGVDSAIIDSMKVEALGVVKEASEIIAITGEINEEFSPASEDKPTFKALKEVIAEAEGLTPGDNFDVYVKQKLAEAKALTNDTADEQLNESAKILSDALNSYYNAEFVVPALTLLDEQMDALNMSAQPYNVRQKYKKEYADLRSRIATSKGKSEKEALVAEINAKTEEIKTLLAPVPEDKPAFKALKEVIAEAEGLTPGDNFDVYVKQKLAEAKALTNDTADEQLNESAKILSDALNSYYNAEFVVPALTLLDEQMDALNMSAQPYNVRQKYKKEYADLRSRIATSKGKSEKEALVAEINAKTEEIKTLLAPVPEDKPAFKALKEVIAEAEGLTPGDNFDVYVKQKLAEAKALTNDTADEQLNESAKILSDALNSYYNAELVIPALTLLDEQMDALNMSAQPYNVRQKYKKAYADLQNRIATSKGKAEKEALVTEINAKTAEIKALLTGTTPDEDDTPLDLGLEGYPYKDELTKAERIFRSYKTEGAAENVKKLDDMYVVLDGLLVQAKAVQRLDNDIPGAWDYFQKLIQKIESRKAIIYHAEVADIVKLRVLREDVVQLTAGILEYKEATFSSDDVIEKQLKEKYPNLVVLAKGTIESWGSATKEREVFPMFDNAMVKNTRLFKTNVGDFAVVTFKGLERNQPTDETGTHFNYAHLGKVFMAGEEVFKPLTTYSFYDSQNMPEGMEGLGVGGYQGIYPPKEFIFPAQYGKDIELRIAVAQMGSSAVTGYINLNWQKTVMADVHTKEALDALFTVALAMKQSTKTDAAFETFKKALAAIQAEVGDTPTTDEIVTATDKVNAAIAAFRQSEDNAVGKAARRLLSDYGKMTRVFLSAISIPESKEAYQEAVADLETALDEFTSEERVIEKMKTVHDIFRDLTFYYDKKTNLYVINEKSLAAAKPEDDKARVKIDKYLTGRILTARGEQYLNIDFGDKDISELQLFVDADRTQTLDKTVQGYVVAANPMLPVASTPEDVQEANLTFKLGGTPAKQYYVTYRDTAGTLQKGLLVLEPMNLDTEKLYAMKFAVARVTDEALAEFVKTHTEHNLDALRAEKKALTDEATRVLYHAHNQAEINNTTKQLNAFLNRIQHSAGKPEAALDLPDVPDVPDTILVDGAEIQPKDGVYEAEANGYEGPVKLQVTIKDHKISAIKVLAHNETPNYFDMALGIIGDIIDKNGTQAVDTITGATISANAIKKAVDKALAAARQATVEDNETPVPPVTDEVVSSTVYSARIKHEIEDKDSMANKALVDKSVRIDEYKSGKYKYTVRLVPIKIGDEFGNVTKLFTYRDGQLTEAVKGSDDTWTFDLIEKKARVEIRVWVDAMDNIGGGGPGSNAQNAILVVDFDKVVDGSVPDQPDQPVPPQKNGWVTEDGNTYYYKEGVAVTNNWISDNGSRYWLKADGAMAVKEWIRAGDKSYYATKSGAILQDKWLYENNAWYYFTGNGSMAVNQWAYVDGRWYWAKADGIIAQSQWVFANGKWYWASGSGAIAIKQWVFANGKWYWATGSGAIAERQWVLANGKWYYALADGKIAMNQWIRVNNVWYWTAADGAVE
ncbi:MAG: FMN-binding protein [Eubacteriales bacterium]|nr:FMN-binding protein [Eubacteriales bacterium]